MHVHVSYCIIIVSCWADSSFHVVRNRIWTRVRQGEAGTRDGVARVKASGQWPDRRQVVFSVTSMDVQVRDLDKRTGTDRGCATCLLM